MRQVTHIGVTIASHAYTSDVIFSKKQYQLITKRLTFIHIKFYCEQLVQNYAKGLFCVFVDYPSYFSVYVTG